MTLKFREPLNGLTHAVGAVLAVVGLVLLIRKGLEPTATAWHVVTFTIFGVALILLYLCSTLYHWLPLAEVGIKRLKRLDHTMIFVLIAATYTPICLLPLRGPWGWSIFGVVWGIAFLGIFFKLFWLGAPRWLSTAIYIVMGWVVLVAIWPLAQSVEVSALAWLALGGLAYTVGAVIYGLKRPNYRWMGFHEIFHVLCIAGSVCHYWMVYRYL